jgi:uncharacterized tellurite resistance protein B-like protein
MPAMSFELTPVDVMGLSDDQKAAVLDALVAAAWADGSVSQAEAARFELELVKTPLAKDEQTLGKMVMASRERFASLKSKEAVFGFIKGIADKLPLPHIREKVLYTMGVVAFAEGSLNVNEKNVIAAFAQAFNVTKDRFDLIGKRVQGVD